MENILYVCLIILSVSGKAFMRESTIDDDETSSPGYPFITGYDGTPLFPGNKVVLKCTAYGGIPLATLIWACKGTDVSGSSSGTSSHTVTIDTTYNGQTCSCTASHKSWTVEKIIHSEKFVVHYPPSFNPKVIGYDSSIRYQGDTVTLTCQVSGGSPLATLSWICNGRQVTQSSIISGTNVSSVITLSMTAEYNSKTCVCQGRHSDPSYKPDISTGVFKVYYPPTTPILQTSGTSFPWVENTQGVLKCITTSGNPPQTTYEWIQNSHVITGQTSDTFTIPTLTSVYNGKRIQCRVSNAYTVQRPPAKISNITVLDVQYSPIITLDTTNITIEEGKSLSRLCSATGNPTPTVKWYRRNVEQSSGTRTSATLVLSDIDRNQADTYTCKASSTGRQNFENGKSLSVIVYYPPAMTINQQNATENATNVVLTCNADGLPTNYTYHGWIQYVGNTVVRENTAFTGILSENNRKIILPLVTFQDIGIYHCFSDNGIQGRQTAILQKGSTYFDVKASAKFDRIEKRLKPGYLHKNATVGINFFSNPPAANSDVKWINRTNGNQLTNSGVISLSLTNTQLQRSFYGKTVILNGQSATLYITSLQSFHLGQYTLIIQNGGNLTSSFNFEIITSAQPDRPLKFTLFDIKINSVILTWEKGFNGGHPQTFVIKYTDVETDNTQEKKIKDTRLTSNYTAKITGLKSGTTYLFWIYSTNMKGNSSYDLKPIFAQTLEDQKFQSQAVIIGGVAGTVSAVMIIILLITVFIIYRRRKNNVKDNGDTKKDKTNTTYENVDSIVDMLEVNMNITVRDTVNSYENIDDNVFMSEIGTNQTVKDTENGNTRKGKRKTTYENVDNTAVKSKVSKKKTIQDTEKGDTKIDKPRTTYEIVMMPEVSSKKTVKDTENVDTKTGKTNYVYENCDNSMVMSGIDTHQTTDNAFSGLYANDLNTYDSLDKTMKELETNNYEKLNNKDSKLVPMRKAYDNTTIGLKCAIKK